MPVTTTYNLLGAKHALYIVANAASELMNMYVVKVKEKLGLADTYKVLNKSSGHVHVVAVKQPTST